MPEPTATPETPVVPAAAPPTEYKDLSELTDKQDAHWRLTGELPEKAPKETPKPKTDEAAPPVEAESATDEGTEAKQEQEQKPSKMGYGELRAHIKKLEAELAASKTAPKADAQVEPPQPKAEKLRTKPTLEDKEKDGQPKYKNWEEYNEDLIDWKAEQKFTEYRKAEEKAKQEAATAEQARKITETWNERVKKASAKYPDLKEALSLETGPGNLIQKGSVVDAWILDSDLGPDILHHFHLDRDDLERIGALHPIAATRELTKLEIKLSGEPTKAPPPAEPPVKTTKTPPPAREVGGRGSSAVDDVTKAVADDDFTAYKAAADRRAIAASK